MSDGTWFCSFKGGKNVQLSDSATFPDAERFLFFFSSEIQHSLFPVLLLSLSPSWQSCQGTVNACGQSSLQQMSPSPDSAHLSPSAQHFFHWLRRTRMSVRCYFVLHTMNSLLPYNKRCWGMSGGSLPGPPPPSVMFLVAECLAPLSFCLPFSGLYVPRLVN